VTLLLAGLSPFIYRMITAGTDFSNPPSIVAFKPLAVPLLSDFPVVGEILFNQSPLVYLAFLLVPVVGYVLYRTPLGLAVRTVGENPLSAEAAGLDVYRLRIGAVTAGCALMGIAGAYLSISYFNGFLPDMVAGRGWIAIALVIFANWRPVRILLASILFAGVEALAVRIETLGLDVPYPVFLALPYVLTILVLIGVARNATYPKALAVPFRRGARA
jgi:simple sugar transport system permease protein